MTRTPRRLPPALGAHRVLADGESAALLRRDGEVDWWCVPGFDGVPLLWSLLDDGGAAARWLGTRGVEVDPVPASPALRTLLHADAGRVECLDGLVDGVLVRLVRGLDGDLDLVHEVTTATWPGGPDDAPSPDCRGGGAVGGAPEGTRQQRVRGPVGTWQVVLVGRPDDLAGAHLDAPVWHDALIQGRETADAGVRAARRARSHPERSRDALRVLESLAAPTGAVVAALTTSLPESVPGERQWDYRYCWLRDAALATSAASLLGATTASDGFHGFALDVLGDDPMAAPPLARTDGGTVPDEVEVPGVAGWSGAQPVRVGNDARGQVQHDALGLFVESVSVRVQTGGSLDDRTWRAVRRIADGITDLVLADEVEPSSGVWELREPRRLVSEDVGRWLALDRAVWLGRLRLRRSPRWQRARDLLSQRVLSATRPDGTLPLDYDDPDGPCDASALLVPLLGMQRGEAARPLVLGTLRRLGAGPFVHRYDPATRPGEAWDGMVGREATFLPVSFMAVGALAAAGLRDEARERLDAMCAVLPRLLPEMWDPVDDRGLGNVPLVWSHMELARAAYVLDALDLRARWGPVGFAVWRAARYVGLRRARSAPGPQPRP